MAKKKKAPLKTKKAESTITQKAGAKRNYTAVFIAIIAVLTFIAYSGSFKGEFLNWDDNVYITQSDLIKDLSNDGIEKMFTEYHNSNYHPFTTISFALQYKLSGGEPGLFHIINFIFHLLNTLLVFYFIVILTKRQEIAFIVSLFFGIHPMHVESVAWISEHKDLLYTFFYLLALVFYLFYIKNTKKLHWLLISLILAGFSLFSKSAAVIFPLVLILIDYYYKRKTNLRLILEKIPFFAIAVLFGILAIYSQQSDASINMLDYSLIDRLFLACYAILYYIFMLFIPTGLSAMHYYPLKVGDYLPFAYYLSPILIMLIIYLVFKAKKLKRELIFGFLFFLINLLLVIQIIPVGRAIVAERYTYIPYIGLLFIIGHYFSAISENKIKALKKLKTPFIIALFIFALVFTFATWNRTQVWKNSTVLLDDVIEKYPERGFAYYARANIKVNEQNPQGAFDDYNKAIMYDPDIANAYHSRALLQYTFKNDPRAAMNDYNKAIEINPEFVTAYNDRGSLKYRLGDYKGALEDYNTAIDMRPEYYLAIKNCGLAKYQLKDYHGALENFERVIELKPDYAEVYYFMGYANFDSGNKEEACIDWQKALEMGYNQAGQKIQENCK
jgi:tetratricopeptide (TPR) repeat protein